MRALKSTTTQAIDWDHRESVQHDANDTGWKGEPPMNRLPTLGFALVVVLLLRSPAIGQKPSPDWKTLKPGVQVLNLWETIGPTKPQIAIFQLSNEAYKELQRDPKAFVDGYNIFGEPVRTGPSLTELLSAKEGYSGEWTAACFHRVSMMRCSSYPVEPDQKHVQNK
jgi:hypothetical protein